VLDVITLSRPSIPPSVASPRLRSRSSTFHGIHCPLSNLVPSLSLNHHLYAEDAQLFFSFYPHNFDSNITHLQTSLQQISCWMTANILTLNPSKTEFLLTGLKKQLDKIHNSSLKTTHSARNLGFIFDEHLTFSDQISAISKACYYHIRQLRCIRPCLDSTTACTIATSIVHSKLDYCNSHYYNLPKSEITRLQLIQNSLDPAVVKAPKSCHITPVLRSVHWLKITERIEYKLLSLSYKVLITTQTPYLNQFTSVQPPCGTRSSSLVILARPPTSSWLPITDRSLRCASPCLCYQIPSSFRQPRFSPSVSVLPVHAPTTSHFANSPLSPSITPSLFHSRLKTYTSFTNLSHHRLPSSLRTDSTDFTTGPFRLSISVFCF